MFLQLFGLPNTEVALTRDERSCLAAAAQAPVRRCAARMDAESPSKRIAVPTAAKVEKKRRFAEGLLMAAD